MPANYSPGSAPTPKALPAPSPRLTPVQHAAQSMGAAKAGNAVARTPVYHAPAPPRLTPVQHAAQSMGAAHAGNAVAHDNPTIHSGLGLTQHQAAMETMNQAKTMLPTSQDYAPTAPHISAASHGGGYGAQLAAIRAPNSSGVLHTLDNLAGSAISLPLHMVEGMAQLGKAGVEGVASGHIFSPDPTQNPFAKAVGGMIHADPFYQAVDRGSLQPLVDHPLNTALDLAGGYGALGRGAGALAREANLGGATARADHLLNPEIPGSAVHQSYSPNLFTNVLQKRLEGSSIPSLLPDAVSKLRAANAERKQTSLAVGTEKSANQRAQQEALSALDAVKPKGKAEANSAPLVAGFGIPASGTALDTVAHFKKVWEDQLNLPHAAKNLKANAANATAAVNKGPMLDTAAMEHAAQVFHDLHGPLDQAKTDLNILGAGEAQKRIEAQYALEQMPGVHRLDAPVIHPDHVAETHQAKLAVNEADAQLKAAETARTLDAGLHRGASSQLSDASRRLPVHPATDTFANHLLDHRAILDASGPARAAEHDATVAAAKANYKDAVQTHKSLVENPKMLGGLVRHDPSARPLTTGTIRGLPAKDLPLGPVSREEVQQHMATSSVAPSYLNAANLEREKAITLGADPRGAGSSSLPYTGREFQQGGTTPGWDMLTHTLNSSLSQVGKARMLQNLMDRFGMRHFDGAPLTQDNIQSAMAKYEGAYGTPMKFMHDPHIDAPDRGVVMMPASRVNEIQKHLNLAAPGPLARANSWVSRKFANTVLPTSSKLMVAHPTEMLVRGGLAGAKYGDGELAREMLSRMSPEGASRLTDLATPGGMGGHVQSLSDSAKGVVGARIPGRIERAAGAPSRAWDTMAHKIIGMQRATIKPAERAALGVHIRQTARDLGIDPYKNVDRLAAAYESPALQEHAAQFHADKMGKYTNLTAGSHALNRISPFAPWYANAAKLAYKGMPLEHPLLTSGLTNEAAYNQPAWDQLHAGMPSDMQSFLPLNPGHFLDTGKFGPLGVDKNPLNTALGLVAPAYQGGAKALFGLDAFGKPIKDAPAGSLNSVLHAADTFGHGVLGPIGPIANALQDHGQTLKNTSLPLFGKVQLKPHTSHGPGGIPGGFERWLNPFHGVWMKTVGGGSTTTQSAPIFTPTRGGAASPATQGVVGAFHHT